MIEFDIASFASAIIFFSSGVPRAAPLLANTSVLARIWLMIANLGCFFTASFKNRITFVVYSGCRSSANRTVTSVLSE